MKKYVFVFCLFFVLSAWSQRKPIIKGSKIVAQKEESLQPYNQIYLQDNLDIQLKKGAEGYFLNADDNLHDILKFEVLDSVLTISSFYKVKGKKKLEIVVAYNELIGVHINKGLIKSDAAIKSHFFEAIVTGEGIMEADIQADVVSLRLEKNAKLISNVTSDSLHIAAQAKTDLELFVKSQEVVVDAAGSAKVVLEGNTHSFQCVVLKNASVRAEKLLAEMAIIDVTGDADVRTNINQTVSLSLSGASKCQLYGEPQINLVSFTDTASLFKKK